MDTVREKPTAAPATRPRPDQEWPGRTVHALIAARAATQPDAVALIHRHTPVTYRELDRLANAYAGALHAAGVRPGDYVPIRLRRSVPLIALALAVLKLGAAYALMDPGWPAERIRDEVEQMAARLLVTDEPAAVPEAGVPIWQPPASVDVDNPAPYPATAGHGADACAVFFTSGTTGRPKGAVSPHSGVIRLVDDGSIFNFGPGTVMTNAGSLPWDVFSFEVWAPLVRGGTSVLIDDPYLSGGLLRELVTRHRLTATFATTSLFNMLVDEDLASFAGLRVVIVGGERLSVARCRAFLSMHPDTVLVNGYGPVEATVFATTRIITMDDCALADGIPIGTPVPHTGIHLRNGDRPCADDEIGEVCISGAGLAIGYLGRPDLTAEKFVTIPNDGRPERVYRTGDLGLRDCAGVLHYRGRLDRQVKIRGYRVELAEIEAVVNELPGVRNAAVLPRKNEHGTCTGMIGFLLPQSSDTVLDPRQLRELLTNRVPAYQIPDRLIVVEALPLLPNGKLDAAALMRTADDHPANQTAPHDAPADDAADPLTLAVREVVAATLSIPVVPDNTVFQALGASSLDLGRIAARLGQRLDRPVPLSQLFRSPTVAGMAQWLALGTTGAVAAAGSLDDPQAPAPLSGLQTLMTTEYLIDPDKRDMHCAFVWRVPGRPDRAALRAAFAALHRRHPALRARYQLGSPAMAIPVDVPPPTMLESLVPTEADALVQLSHDLARPFAPDGGDVWRPIFIAVREAPVTLLGIAVHHVAVDGGSGHTLAVDLSAAYEAVRHGQEPDTDGLTLAGIAAARDAHLSHVDLDWQRDLLRRTLTGVPDLVFPPVTTADKPAGTLRQPIPAALRSAAEGVAAALGVSPFVVYLTAYTQTMAELTGQVDFGIGTSINRRGHAQLDAAVTCLIDVLCLRPMVAPDLSPDLAIARTAAAAAATFSAQDVPIHECAQLVGAPTGAGRQPLFQNMFLLQDNRDATLTLDGRAAPHVRPDYPGVPSEMVTELWPEHDGGAYLLIGHRTAAVSAEFCAQFAQAWLARLATITQALSGPSLDTPAGTQPLHGVRPQ